MPPLVDGYAPVRDALERVRAKIRVKRIPESVSPLRAFGRVSAQDIRAAVDVPAHSTSHMDGFAVRAEDLRQATPDAPVALRVVGALGPGDRPVRPLRSGEAARVATGARLPTGADAVIPVELAVTRGREVLANSPVAPGDHVYANGGDIRRGEIITRAGRSFRAQDIGLLIALGYTKVQVWRRPRVSVLPTGSELAPAGRRTPGKITDSHSPVFIRLCGALGCETVEMGIARDEPRALLRALRSALSKSDFILTLGGTSVGRRDLVVGAVAGLRPDLIVHGTRMDRGRVAGVAVVGGKPVLMMPGPIQGAMNAFLLIGIPIIEALSGRESAALQLPCTLSSNWEARKKFSNFEKVVYVKLRRGEGLVAEPLRGETESIKVLADADGYFVAPEDVVRLDSGSPVNVRFVPGFSSIW